MAKGTLEREGFGPPEVQMIGLHGIGYANRLRALDDANVTSLAASMKEVGLLSPITVCPQTSGIGYWLVMGLHRLEAAKRLKWDSIPAIIASMDDLDARMAEIDENLIRGELTPAQRAMHIAERKKIYEARHPETKHGAAGNGREKSRQFGDSTLERFTAVTAEVTRTPERTVQRDAARGTKVADLHKVVGTSLDKGDELDALTKLSKPAQEAIIARAEAGEKVSAKTELKKAARNEKEVALAGKIAAISQKVGTQHYGVVYSDPPWAFEPYSRETGMDRAADNHYPTASLDEIKALKPPAAKDAALFLWSTVPMLPEALEVMQAWGFTYKSHWCWVKDRTGTGYWGRNKHELLLIGTRGDIPAPAPGMQPESAVILPVGRHSAKPLWFRDIIGNLFPNVPKLEMFARETGEGWDLWGAEAPQIAAE